MLEAPKPCLPESDAPELIYRWTTVLSVRHFAGPAAPSNCITPAAKIEAEVLDRELPIET